MSRRDRFEKFLDRLYAKGQVTEEGTAALPTTLAETVRALDPRALQALSRSTLSMAPFLMALEESQIPETSLRYLLVHDEIGPAAFLVFTVLRLDLAGMIGGALSKPQSRRRKALEIAAHLLQRKKRGESTEGLRLLMGGHPLFWGNHFFNLRDPDPPPSLIATLVQAGYRMRKLEGIKVSVLKDFTSRDLPRLDPLERYGYVRFETQPNMLLRIDPEWKTFGGYLAVLSGRYRKLVRERRHAFESGGLTIEPARPTPIAAELAELYGKSWERATTRLLRLTPSFFRATEERLRDAFRVWVVRRAGRIIAFVSAIADRVPASGRNRLLGLFLGMENESCREHKVYWNLLYRLVEEAIAGEFAELDLGRTALQPKAELGAQPDPLFCLIRHRNPTSNQVVRFLFDQIIEPSRAPERHAIRQ